MDQPLPDHAVAIIGMAGRFPGAAGIRAFWQNLLNGVESISRFDASELEDCFGATTWALPNFVPARAVLENVDRFDAPFFAMQPREAALTDPQQRVLLECAWEALEDAGYDPATPGSCIGVFAGATSSTYLLQHLLQDRAAVEQYTSGFQLGNLPTLLGSAADFTATRIGYKLGLTGPCVAVQSACSTSLLAVAQAVQSLLCHGCDMALAGGVSISLPQRRGYLAQEGGMGSTDGHCRAFDASANGTVFGNGAGLVVLKRLADAVADRDHIYAVIRGVGINNDGAGKVGFTAPSVDGQAAVIAMAHAAAGVDARSIGYVEAHGTGTPMGDPIEVAGLTAAFRVSTEDCGFCALGSVKSNVGHLDAAAGVTGLIKAALAVESGTVPASLHVTEPNPALNLAESPFFIADRQQVWPAHDGPRRAGVSAFGVGGTNVHVVLEQAPEAASEAPARRSHILPLSARTPAALAEARARLADHIEARPEQDVADIAFTLQTGRRHFAHRFAATGHDRAELAAALRKPGAAGTTAADSGDLVFMFPGQGSQHPNMARELYAGEPLFRGTVDLCAEVLRPKLGLDLRSLLYPSDGRGDPERLSDTMLAQPAIFTVEYALAELLMSWGLRPSAMIGHSVGEFAAACLAGVFSLEDALGLVATRGRLMQELPRGAMVAVRLPDGDVQALARGGVSVAAFNAPGMSVLAGPFEAIEALEAEFAQRDVVHRRLQTSHAFHSGMLDPLIAPFTEAVSAVRLSAPLLPYISGVSGEWVTAEQTTSPEYWARHAREPVRFSGGIATLTRDLSPVFLEVGPGAALSSFALQGAGAGRLAISCLPKTEDDAEAMVASAVARLWTAGVAPDWSAYQGGGARKRVPLPTYPFERSRHWVEAPASAATPAPMAIEPPSSEPAPSQPDQEPAMSRPAETVSAASQAALGARVAAIFENLSGRSFGAEDNATSFVELGFDSLLLTQAAQNLQTSFGVPIRFRQLLDDLGSVDDVTRHIAEVMPPEPAPVPAPVAAAPSAPAAAASPVPATAAPVAAPRGDGSIDALMREQLAVMSRLMEQQLHALNGTSAAPARIVEAPAVIAAAVTPTVASAIAAPKPAAPAQAAAGETGSRIRSLIRSPGAAALGEGQRAHIQRLIDRYVARTGGSKRLTQEHRGVLADPRTVAGFAPEWKEMVYPIVAARAKGARIWDVDGNSYIDLVNGYGQTAFGHSPDFVVEAVQAQLAQGFAIGPQTPLAHEAAKLFCELTGHARVAFCNTGSEAVMAAMRIARTVTGRDRVVVFSGAYHGQFDEVLARGVGSGEQRRAVPAAPGIPMDAVSRLMVLDYGTDESLDWLRRHAHEVAAVLVEPVQSRQPGYLPVDFLKELRRITAEKGAALVFDEVVMGFRVHPAGVQGLLGIAPDMATYGKVVGGGMPIGLLAGQPRFMDALDGGAWQYGDDSAPEVGMTFFAGTFVRHPAALAATVAVLKHVKAKGPALTEALTARMQRLAGDLRAAFSEVGWDVPIESYGSVLYFEPGRDHRLGSLLPYHLRTRGIFVQEHYPCFLTTEHGEAEHAAIVAAFRDSLQEMRREGMLPASSQDVVSIPGPAPQPQPQAPQPLEIPLTEPQTEIWLSAQTGPEASAAFNESVSLTLDGSIDVERLAQAVRAVASRHAILTTTFSPEGETMRMAPESTMPIAIVDLAGETDPDAALRTRIEARAEAPFDLVRGPVAEAEIVRLSEGRHVLVLSAHHIVCDGWSTNMLLQEIATAYRSGASTLGPVMTFADYAARTRLDGRRAESEEYWVKVFAELPEPLELPTDRPRSAERSFKGGTRTSFIDAELYRNVKSTGARRRRTLFATLFTAFQVLLFRLSGQRDLVIGVPAAGQSLLTEVAPVGHCVNFLPIRGTVEPGQSFADQLDRTSRVILDAYDHQSCTLGALLKRLRVPAVQGRLPLTEVQFNLESLAGSLDFGPGIMTAAEPNPKAFSTFDLYFNIIESSDGLRIDCHYGADLFDAATIDRWLGHFRMLLAAFVAEPEAAVATMSMGDDTERGSLMSESRGPDIVIPDQHSAIGAFEQQAQQRPEAAAISFGGQDTSYGALNAWADRIAAELTARIGSPESRVALMIERSPALVAAMLGALKAGFPYVPLDLATPPARIRTILKNSGAVALLTAGPLPSGLLGDKAAITAIDVHETDPKLAGIRAASQAPDHLAYVIYTSGSTGTPKGVEVTHRGLTNLLFAMAREPGFDSTDTLLAVTTVTFDIAALELLLPLTQGGRVAIATADETKDGAELLARLEHSGATVMQATPMTWRLLLAAGFRSRPGFRMLCGGEALPRDLAMALLEGGGELWNMYGPTETTIWSSLDRVRADDAVIAIGRPIANTQFYIVDGNDQLVPVGIPGELLIAGDGLARGYAGNPDLTARSFIRNPIGHTLGARAYRTGDRARCLPDGRIQHLGRLDHQVKLRGFRIEPGEIEAVLARKAGLVSAVILREDVPNEPRLVCYYLAAGEGGGASPAELRKLLAEDLPDYMIPAAWMKLSAMPLNPSGKLDRSALPAPELAPSQPRAERAAPRSPVEETLLKIWSEVLHRDDLGTEDDLFDLGADSLAIFQITGRARREGIKLAARDLFRNRTVAGVAAALAAAAPADAATAAPTTAAPPFWKLPWRRSLKPLGRNSEFRTEDAPSEREQG